MTALGPPALLMVAFPLLLACSVDDVSPAPLEAPFAVSDYFVPSGFMGDGALAGRGPDPLELAYDGCRPRPPGARGNCYRFVYRPVPAEDGGVGWAGLYFQSPANNWGQDRPQGVEPTARRVSFLAASDAGGESLAVSIGGLRGNDPEGAPLPYADALALTAGVTLGTELTRHEVLLPAGAVYSYVLGAFGFSLTASGGATQTLFLDDIVWLAE